MKKTICFALVCANMLSFTAFSEHWPTGYYTTVSDPENVYFYDDEFRWSCHIQNESQGNLYNVSSVVRVIGDINDLLNQAVNLNDCQWPNGFYDVTNSDGSVSTYRLYPGNICTITSDQMLAAYGGTGNVYHGDDGSDFSPHRTNIGQCFWPSYDRATDTSQH